MEANPKGARRKAASRDRDANEPREGTVSATTLMGRLERQSGELAIVTTKLEETSAELEQQREEAHLLRQAFEDERIARERLETQLVRERSARAAAERSTEETQVTASALEGQLQLLRAQLKAAEHETRRRRPFGLRRGRR